MTRIINALITSIVIINPLFTFAQNGVTISDTKEFRLEAIDADGKKKILTKTFDGSYSVANQTYTLNDDAGNKLFEQNYPLSRDKFRSEVTSNVNDMETNKIAFTEYSIEQVFLWLYSLNQDLDVPTSGRLDLGRLAQVLEGNSNNDTARIKLIEKLSNSYNELQSLTYTYRSALNDYVQNMYLLVKRIDSLYPKIVNTFPIDTLKRRFETDVYPVLSNTDSLKKYFDAVAGEIKNLLDSTAKLNRESFKDTAAALSLLRKGNFIQNIEDYKDQVESYERARANMESKEKEFHQNDIYTIEKVSVQFERGGLERIQVWVENENSRLDIYENLYSIGFTNVTNYRNFQTTRLFRRSKVANKSIFLSDVITNYNNLLDLYTRDYSPVDTVINEINPVNGPIILKKSEKYKFI